MRAGIARLRAAMTAFARLLDGPETDAIAAELAWLAGELRLTRELDVFLHETLNAMGGSHIDALALDMLRTDVQARLETALGQARTAVTSDRCRQLFLRTALWLVAAEWSDSGADLRDEPNRRVSGFAQRTLEEQTRSGLRTLRRFAHLSTAERDDLRRALTELELAAQLFATVLPSKRRARAKSSGTLAKLLAHLGRLHDIAVNERLHDDFMQTWTNETAPDPRAAQKAFAMGFALGRLQQEKERRATAVRKLAASA
jgi:CHAD domain-containing protein